MQIFDLCRDKSITEAALQASRVDHAGCLRAALYWPLIMRAGLLDGAALRLQKISFRALCFLHLYESIISYSI
jgi:hypothetical protein